MALDIRVARPADAESLSAIDALASATPWSLALFVQACAVQNGGDEPVGVERALVLETEGRVAGFLVFSRVLDEACIHNIAILPTLQGQGLGRQLLSTALQCLRREHVKRCLLEVRASNAAARSLYASAGFGQDGVRKKYYRTAEGREDALLMSRRL